MCVNNRIMNDRLQHIFFTFIMGNVKSIVDFFSSFGQWTVKKYSRQIAVDTYVYCRYKLSLTFALFVSASLSAAVQENFFNLIIQSFFEELRKVMIMSPLSGVNQNNLYFSLLSLYSWMDQKLRRQIFQKLIVDSCQLVTYHLMHSTIGSFCMY